MSTRKRDSAGSCVSVSSASNATAKERAGAAQARLLVLASDSAQTNLDLVHTARRHFPHLTILARAEGRPEAYELIEAGVDHVYRETLESSLRLGIDALRQLGFDPDTDADKLDLYFSPFDAVSFYKSLELRVIEGDFEINATQLGEGFQNAIVLAMPSLMPVRGTSG